MKRTFTHRTRTTPGVRSFIRRINRANPLAKAAKRYQGPSRPVSVSFLTPYERFERVVFLVCLIVLACDLLWWRPN